VELKQIKDLMAAMGRTGTKKICIKKEGFEISLERGENFDPRFVNQQIDALDENLNHADIEHHRAQAFLKGGGKLSPPVVNHEEKLPAQDDSKSLFITSPMVGTFYLAAAPEDPPYIKVGDLIEKGTVVCIIEAMKVMNEVKATVGGEVSEVLVDSGQPIEFGTKLFRIKPQSKD
jgi:acetyl-CoA carboxylase biotin carboxyl carrier protein